MSRDLPKKYPRTVESKNSYLRIRAPEHLDVALEGLIRKVLKEQPKMDDIYAFAADYFDMLLKIRTKAGLRKLSTKDICPNHNEEDAHEMIKLASTFAKRTKESKPKSKTYQALSLRDRNKYKKHTEEQKDQDVSPENENNENLTTLVPRTQEPRKKETEMKPENIDEISDAAKETESDYSVNIPTKETDRIIVKATEVIFEENANEEESPRAVLESVENVGNIDEIRDKIREVESEIKQLDKKETQIESEEIDKEKEAENMTEEEKSINEKGPHEKSYFQGEANVQHAEQVKTDNNEKQEIVGKKETTEIKEEQNGDNDGRVKETNLNTENKEGTKKRNGEPTTDAENTEKKEVEQITENDEKGMESGDEKIRNEEGETNQTPKKTLEEISALGDAEKTNSMEKTPEEKQQILTTAEDLQETKHEGENDAEENSIVSMEAQETVSSTKEDEQQANRSENSLHNENEESKILKGESNCDNSAAITEEAENEGNVQEERGVETRAEEKQLAVIKNDVEQRLQHKIQNFENNAEETTVSFSNLEEEANDDRSANQGEEEGKSNEEIAAQVRSSDSNAEEVIEMLGEGKLKNEKLESGELIVSEKHVEVVENSENANQERSIAETVIEQDAKSDENDSTALMPDNNAGDKGNKGKQAEGTEKNEIEKVSQSSDINLQNGAIGCALETCLQKETTEGNGNSKITEEQTTAAEERLLGTECAKQEATDVNVVQEFLDHEKEYSRHDKPVPIEVKSGADNTESQVKSEAVTDSLTPKTLFPTEALDNEENMLALENERKYENTDWEGDEDQQKDISTTSDEIEFELSPSKYPDDPTSTTGENANTEPVIVVNEDSIEEKMASVEEYVEESKKALLEVPMPVLKEYQRKKISECESDEQHRTKRSVDEKTIFDEPGEEIIIDCGNIGNEIIQRGEVQKVELVEGEEDILQVHLTTTIETEQEEGDTVHVGMGSRIEPELEELVETKLESPIPESHDKLRIVRAAVVIQNGFRRFKNRRNAGEGNKPDNELTSTLEVDSSDKVLEHALSSGDDSLGIGTHIISKDLNGKTLRRRAIRNLFETHSLDPIRKISPLKTRSLSNVRYGVADFEIWNKLVKELEEAATKIQSNYRGYKTRKKLMRGDAVQSMTTTSEDSASAVEAVGTTQRHTGEFHDSIVLALSPK